jgi:alanine-alpha-ketoisovalerate/valine-pyruvate aminotransferase
LSPLANCFKGHRRTRSRRYVYTPISIFNEALITGPRFLLIASLSILTLSRERILALNTAEEILKYLDNLPQDALLLPENYMKACMEVRFKEEDYKRLRAGVGKD